MMTWEATAFFIFRALVSSIWWKSSERSLWTRRFVIGNAGSQIRNGFMKLYQIVLVVRDFGTILMFLEKIHCGVQTSVGPTRCDWSKYVTAHVYSVCPCSAVVHSSKSQSRCSFFKIATPLFTLQNREICRQNSKSSGSERHAGQQVESRPEEKCGSQKQGEGNQTKTGSEKVLRQKDFQGQGPWQPKKECRGKVRLGWRGFWGRWDGAFYRRVRLLQPLKKNLNEICGHRARCDFRALRTPILRFRSRFWGFEKSILGSRSKLFDTILICRV